jgi:hypothetical protein
MSLGEVAQMVSAFVIVHRRVIILPADRIAQAAGLGSPPAGRES